MKTNIYRLYDFICTANGDVIDEFLDKCGTVEIELPDVVTLNIFKIPKKGEQKMAPKITDEEIRKEADKLHDIWWDRNTENDITDTLIEAIKKGIQMKQERIRKQVEKECKEVSVLNNSNSGYLKAIMIKDIDIWDDEK